MVEVSDVFMGFRRVPHFSIAVLKNSETQGDVLIRASMNSEILDELIKTIEATFPANVFLVNHDGILQTDAKQFGKKLKSMGIDVPPPSNRTEIIRTKNMENKEIWLAYSYIDATPFILIEITTAETLMANWIANRNQLLILLIFSLTVIIFVVVWGSSRFVKILKENDRAIAQIMHEIEYTSKMASIGRLAAGVAHEINNPLSIISENTGLIQDLLVSAVEFPEKERINKAIHSIFKSIDRCSKITHQLLGFAKKMEPKSEPINLSEFFAEVVEFVNKYAFLKNIQITTWTPDPGIIISSDKSLLQQVFVNILNNAIESIDVNGKVEVVYNYYAEDLIEVKVTDNGKGIPEKELPHIFEPFYTTKKEYGTGLGLSITYGIIQKLGVKFLSKAKKTSALLLLFIYQ